MADPTRAASTVTVTLNRAGHTTATADPQITVLDTDPITLLVEVGGAHGASRTITFGTGVPVTPGRSVSLTPAADAYVQDGSSAGTNFGADAVLAIKNAAAGFHRRSFLKFDLASVPAAPRRAILWLYGRVSDAGGTQARIEARAVTGDSWTETGLTWNNQPALGATLSTAALGEHADWIPLDVTTHVRSQHAADRVATIALIQATAGLFVALNSRTNTGNRPYLQVIS